MPAETQRLICCGKQLSNEQRLGSTCRDGNTIHLTASLRGGKGGFGNLLRGAGRAATTTNFDACRTLDGRRLREVDAEKKHAEWAAEAQARALEKIAMQHLREQAREARRAELEQVDVQGALEAQQATLASTKTAVADALASGGHPDGGPSNRKRALGGGVQSGRAAKRGMLAELDDDDDLSEEEEDEQVEGGAQAVVVERDIHPRTDTSNTTAHHHAQASGDSVGVQPPPAAAAKQQPATQPPPAEASAQPTQQEAKQQQPTQQEATQQEPAHKEPSYAPINVAAYDSAEALATAHAPQHLKAELARLGLKCGGTPMQRAERLFLLKTVPIEAIHPKHKAGGKGK